MYRQLRPLIGKQEGGKASEDCTVVACRIAVCAIKREGAEGVLGTRRCATGEQQPCNLGVMECREVVEEALLARQDCTQVSFDELRSAKRNAKGNNTALCQRDFLATNPNRGVGGKGKHTRWENASGVPNLGLSSFETETGISWPPTQIGESGARASTPGGRMPAEFQTLVLAALRRRRA
eukprot:s2480_g12.t1